METFDLSCSWSFSLLFSHQWHSTLNPLVAYFHSTEADDVCEFSSPMINFLAFSTLDGEKERISTVRSRKSSLNRSETKHNLQKSSECDGYKFRVVTCGCGEKGSKYQKTTLHTAPKVVEHGLISRRKPILFS